MKRQICWTDRLDAGIKMETRVTFLSGQRLKWQFKRSDAERWDYDSTPSAADWEALDIRTENRYRRRSASILDLQLVRRLRAEAVRKQGGSGDTKAHD